MTDDDLKSLYRHHNATIGLFVAFWLFVLVAVLLIEFFSLSKITQDNLMGTVFGAAIVLCLLQFKRRCPDCRANLGLQRRLGIPRKCAKCGALLRKDPKRGGG
jgi:hypothetical protein